MVKIFRLPPLALGVFALGVVALGCRVDDNSALYADRAERVAQATALSNALVVAERDDRQGSLDTLAGSGPLIASYRAPMHLTPGEPFDVTVLVEVGASAEGLALQFLPLEEHVVAPLVAQKPGSVVLRATFDVPESTHLRTDVSLALVDSEGQYGQVALANVSIRPRRLVDLDFQALSLNDPSMAMRDMDFFVEKGRVHAVVGGLSQSDPAEPAGRVSVWDLEFGLPLVAADAHKLAVIAVEYSEIRQMLASGSRDNTVRLFQSEEGKVLTVLGDHRNEVHGVRFIAQDALLATTGWDGSLWVYDLVDVRTKVEMRLEAPAGVLASNKETSGQTEYLAVGTGRVLQAGAVQIFRVEELAAHLRGGDAPSPVAVDFDDWVTAIEFSPDGERLVVAYGRGRVEMIDATTGERLVEFDLRCATDPCVAAPRDVITGLGFVGPRGVSSVAKSGLTSVWDTETGAKVDDLDYGRPFHASTFSHAHRMVSFSDQQGIAHVISLGDTTFEDLFDLPGGLPETPPPPTPPGPTNPPGR